MITFICAECATKRHSHCPGGTWWLLPTPADTAAEVKAHIRYDVDGTSEMHIEAEHISSQMFRPGRKRPKPALIKLSNGGRVVRTIQLAAVWSVDIDRST